MDTPDFFEDVVLVLVFSVFVIIGAVLILLEGGGIFSGNTGLMNFSGGFLISSFSSSEDDITIRFRFGLDEIVLDLGFFTSSLNSGIKSNSSAELSYSILSLETTKESAKININQVIKIMH